MNRAPPSAAAPSDALDGVTLVFVCLFLVAHVTAWAALPAAAFDDYNKVAEIATHLFALPALFRAHHLREQILIATVVSVLYHSVDNYSGWRGTDVLPFQRLDHGTSTALIATVFLKFLCRTQHVVGTIALVAAVAAAVDVGNVVSSAVVGAVLVLVLITPYLNAAAYRVVGVCVYILSLGAHAPDPAELQLAAETNALVLAFVLQGLSVAAYFVGEHVDDVRRWSHALWHMFAYLSLYVLVGIIARREAALNVQRGARPSRAQYDDLLGQKRHHLAGNNVLLRRSYPVHEFLAAPQRRQQTAALVTRH